MSQSTERFRGNLLFKAWTELVLRHRIVFLLLTFAGTGLAIHTIRTRLHMDNSIEAFGSAQSNAADLLEDFRDDFGRDEAFMIVVEGDVFTLEYVQKLKKLHERVATLNLELETLGERKVDRDLKRNRPVPLKRLFKRWGMAEVVDQVQKEERPHAQVAGGDDPFADFDLEGEGGSSEGAFEEAPERKGWGGEAGGSVMDDVISLINVRRTVGETDELGANKLSIGELMDPMPATAEDVAGLKLLVLGDAEKGLPADRTLIGQVVSADGSLSVLLARTMLMDDDDSAKVHDALVEIIEEFDSEGFRTHIAGMPATAAAIRGLMLRDLRVLFALAMVTLFVLMLFIFRNPLGMLAPAGVVILAGIWGFGTMAALGISMTVISNVLPAFLICVGVGDSIHVQSVYRDALKRGIPNRQAIVAAMADTGMPILFTTVTTALGLLSFQFASMDAIAEMGLIGAIGVGYALLHTAVFLPVMLSFNRKSLFGARPAGKDDFIDRFICWCGGLSGSPRHAENRDPVRARRRLRSTLVGAALILVASFGAASMVRVWHNPLAWIPDDQPIRIAVGLTDNKLGGTANIQLLVGTDRENGVKDGELVQGLEKLETHVRGYVDEATHEKIVGNVTSIVDVVREQSRAWNGGDPAAYRVPEDPKKTRDYVSTFQNQRMDLAKRLLTTDGAKTQMTIRLKWLEATAYRPLSQYLAAGVEKYIPGAKAEVGMTGSVFTLLTTVGALILDLIKSFGIAFGAVAIFMVILLRSLKLGTIAMIPNVMPIILVLGIMGLFGIPIDMANMMIASIALGVAVDDTIHFMHHFRVHYDDDGQVEAAIAHALQHSGRAITMTSILLVAGFAVYLGATIYSLQRFGLLIGMVVGMALISNLILCPALLRFFYKDRPAQSAATL